MYSRFTKNVPTDGRITLIIPTIGRDTLTRTLESLIAQTNPDWNAIVVFDGISPSIKSPDVRIQFIEIPNKKNAGFVRNEGIKVATTEWIGFVDDDDILTPNYIECFNRDKINTDVVLFRMKMPDGKIIPVPGDTEFKFGEVGISFCYKRTIAINQKLLFENIAGMIPGVCEDWGLLYRLRNNIYKIKISPDVTYVVRPN
jgi:glycosyltransferase involved in cell wall biosynthesis